jgi:pyruvate dehydrogenase E1 component beta subunit
VGEWRIVVAELTYRKAISAGIAQEMERDSSVVLLGEDVGVAGSVFKTTEGLFDQFGSDRVRDTPISEQAIVGGAMGAAMTGLRPIANLMYADFLAVCWDSLANQIAKSRYMSNGQISLPLVIQADNGGGLRKGAQHSQSVENWAMAVPGLKVVAPSAPADVVGLMAAAIRDPDPVVMLHHKALYASKGDVPDQELVDELGRARVVRSGNDLTLVALGAMVARAVKAAQTLSEEDGLEAAVVDLRSLVPLDMTTVLETVKNTGWMFTVEENPRLCGWGAELVSTVVEEILGELHGPPSRITTPHQPLPAARSLEDLAIPSVDRIVATVRKRLV